MSWIHAEKKIGLFIISPFWYGLFVFNSSSSKRAIKRFFILFSKSVKLLCKNTCLSRDSVTVSNILRNEHSILYQQPHKISWLCYKSNIYDQWRLHLYFDAIVSSFCTNTIIIPNNCNDCSILSCYNGLVTVITKIEAVIFRPFSPFHSFTRQVKIVAIHE